MTEIIPKISHVRPPAPRPGKAFARLTWEAFTAPRGWPYRQPPRASSRQDSRGVAPQECSKAPRVAGEGVVALVARVDRWAAQLFPTSVDPRGGWNGDLPRSTPAKTPDLARSTPAKTPWRKLRAGTSGVVGQHLQTPFSVRSQMQDTSPKRLCVSLSSPPGSRPTSPQADAPSGRTRAIARWPSFFRIEDTKKEFRLRVKAQSTSECAVWQLGAECGGK